MAELTAKSQVLLPPVDLSALHAVAPGTTIRRQKRTIFVETRDADVTLLNAAFATLRRRGETFKLFTIGNLDGVSPELVRTTLPENDETAHAAAMLQSGVFVSAKPDAACDHHAVRALAAGCWPVVPNGGVYRELLPEILHSSCLYEAHADTLASRLQDVFHLEMVDGYEQQLLQSLRRFDPLITCRAMDDRLADLVSRSSRR
jgi:hypothetical protein